MRYEFTTPVLQGTNASAIHQSLETLGKLREVIKRVCSYVFKQARHKGRFSLNR